MKKKISVLLAWLMVVGLFLVSCGGGESALLGKWFLVDGWGAPDEIEFLKDGKGFAEGDEVTWKTEKDRLDISLSKQTASFKYQLADSKLTLTDDDEYVYLKAGGPSALAGKWVSTDKSPFATLELAKDGNGESSEDGSFKWAADKTKLYIIDTIELEYKVSGSTLTLTYEGETIELKKE
jgi:hypothetical protein